VGKREAVRGTLPAQGQEKENIVFESWSRRGGEITQMEKIEKRSSKGVARLEGQRRERQEGDSACAFGGTSEQSGEEILSPLKEAGRGKKKNRGLHKIIREKTHQKTHDQEGKTPTASHSASRNERFREAGDRTDNGATRPLKSDRRGEGQRETEKWSRDEEKAKSKSNHSGRGRPP